MKASTTLTTEDLDTTCDRCMRGEDVVCSEDRAAANSSWCNGPQDVLLPVRGLDLSDADGVVCSWNFVDADYEFVTYAPVHESGVEGPELEVDWIDADALELDTLWREYHS